MNLKDLRDAVATMRELGVTEWNGIKLGPDPKRPAATHREPSTPRLTPEEIRHATLFGASRIRPILPKPETPAGAVPKAVVARKAAADAIEGPAEGKPAR